MSWSMLLIIFVIAFGAFAITIVAMAIGVLSGNAKREHLEPLTDFIFDDVADLPAFFRESRHVL